MHTAIDADTQTHPSPGQLDVETWRAHRFTTMGCGPVLSLELARTTIDLHRFEHLIDHGCPPDLAARILR